MDPVTKKSGGNELKGPIFVSAAKARDKVMDLGRTAWRDLLESRIMRREPKTPREIREIQEAKDWKKADKLKRALDQVFPWKSTAIWKTKFAHPDCPEVTYEVETIIDRLVDEAFHSCSPPEVKIGDVYLEIKCMPWALKRKYGSFKAALEAYLTLELALMYKKVTPSEVLEYLRFEGKKVYLSEKCVAFLRERHGQRKWTENNDWERKRLAEILGVPDRELGQ